MPRRSHKNKKYSVELKMQAVQSYLNGEGGLDKLKDNRGRTKPVEEMTEVEKLKAEMKILEAKNRQLEIENAFIKKLQELKGGGR